MRILRPVVAGAVLAGAVLFGTGCAPGRDPGAAGGAQPGPQPGVQIDAGSGGYEGAPAVAGPSGGPPDLGPPANVGRVVYFDFDSFEIRPESRPVIEAHARYLAAHSAAAAVLEGHSDPQGTREYNIALGERRAEAVRRLLAGLGVAARQVSTLSYGEERPAVTGQSEPDYAQNRRVEIVY